MGEEKRTTFAVVILRIVKIREKKEELLPMWERGEGGQNKRHMCWEIIENRGKWYVKLIALYRNAVHVTWVGRAVRWDYLWRSCSKSRRRSPKLAADFSNFKFLNIINQNLCKYVLLVMIIIMKLIWSNVLLCLDFRCDLSSTRIFKWIWWNRDFIFEVVI